MIPKIIHYCWFGPKQLGKTDQKCIKSWKKYLPDFELMLWNEKNSPIDVPFVKNALEAKKYAFAADYVRVWALNNYGGIYMDTDMLLLKNISNFCNEEFIGCETPDYISCGIFSAKKDSKYISEIMKKYNTLTFNIDNLQEISIPKIFNQIIKPLPEEDKPKIYPPEYFYPLPMEATVNGDFKYKKFLKENSVAVHLWNASWLDDLNEYRRKNRGLRKYWNIIKAHLKLK